MNSMNTQSLAHVLVRCMALLVFTYGLGYLFIAALVVWGVCLDKCTFHTTWEASASLWTSGTPMLIAGIVLFTFSGTVARFVAKGT
jgi:hypothetical protein